MFELVLPPFLQVPNEVWKLPSVLVQETELSVVEIATQTVREYLSYNDQRESVKRLLHYSASLPLTAARTVHTCLITKHLR